MKYIIDLDGTLMAGDKAINSSLAFLRHLMDTKTDFVIMTNSVAPVSR